MPDLMDRLYCSEQIHIPPTFPFIMKLYCKAAIRTQPYDLLKWSAAYFRALANGEEPPVKDRIEYPPYDSPTGLTPGYIKMLLKQLGKDPTTMVSAQTLFVKWNCVCLEDELLIKLVALMGAKTNFNWLKFVAVACGYISTSLTNTMILISELLTDEPEGGMATIPLDVFCDLYSYLAYMECGPLTEEELKQLDDKELEEDVSVIADKIRGAVYEGEGGEDARESMGEAIGEGAQEEAEAPYEGDVAATEKDSDEDLKDKMAPGKADAAAEVKDAGRGSLEGEGDSSEEDDKSRENRDSKESLRLDDVGSAEPADDAVSFKEEGSMASRESTSVENEEIIKEEAVADGAEGREEPGREEGPGGSRGDDGKDRRGTRKIKLEDMEDSIRRKIEAKLEEDEETCRSDEGFEELGSYLLDAAARVRAYTAEEIGYRIFKKYMRQEVPGIGPRIDKAEVEKVLDFMDYNSHKQEGMVMPRNIRHWMCPPLDKVPLQEP